MNLLEQWRDVLGWISVLILAIIAIIVVLWEPRRNRLGPWKVARLAWARRKIARTHHERPMTCQGAMTTNRMPREQTTRDQASLAAARVALGGMALWLFGLLALLAGSGWGMWPLFGGLALCLGAVAVLGAIDPAQPTYGHMGDHSVFSVRTSPEEHFIIGEDRRLKPAPVETPGINLTRDRYVAYLQSDHWKATRARKLAEVGPRCQLCGGTHRLEVHHNCYGHLGQESMSELIVLCRDCHRHFHQGRRVRSWEPLRTM